MNLKKVIIFYSHVYEVHYEKAQAVGKCQCQWIELNVLDIKKRTIIAKCKQVLT